MGALRSAAGALTGTGATGASAALLLIADSRLPAGGHAHSGGAEEAVHAGAITGPGDLARFLRGRLATAGLVAAALAAAACHLAGTPAARPGSAGASGAGGPGGDPARPGAADPGGPPGGAPPTGGGDAALPRPRLPVPDPDTAGGSVASRRPLDDPAAERAARWRELDAEADARTASPAQRAASRTQGRLLVRTARRIWPSAVLDGLAAAIPDGAHHPIALGAACAAAGCPAGQAALVAAYTAVTGPATAAVRLLGLDPVTVHRVLADLGPELDRTAEAAVAAVAACLPGGGDAGTARPDWSALPSWSAPALDLLAEAHLRREVRLFVS
ncbi:MAG: urease accessory UreF family protein [Actinomycetes bacterium]